MGSSIKSESLHVARMSERATKKPTFFDEADRPNLFGFKPPYPLGPRGDMDLGSPKLSAAPNT